MTARTFTLQDPACRSTVARMRWQFRAMKQLGIARAVDGARLTPAAKTDVRESWRRGGWKRPTKASRKAA